MNATVIKRRVVCQQNRLRVTEESDEFGQNVFDRRLAANRFVCDAVNLDNVVGNTAVRINQLLHQVEFDSVRSEPNRSDLNDAIEIGRESGRFEIERDEVGVVHEWHWLSAVNCECLVIRLSISRSQSFAELRQSFVSIYQSELLHGSWGTQVAGR